MKKFLAVALSAAMIVSSAIPGYAAEESAVVLEETVDAAYEASSMESTEDETAGAEASEDATDFETEETPSEAASEATSETALEEEIELEEIVPEEVEIADEAATSDSEAALVESDEEIAEFLSDAEPSACFDVDADGTLIWKDDTAKVPTTAYIPASVKKITSKFFTDDRFKGKDTKIFFLGDKAQVVIEEQAFFKCKNLRSIKDGAAIKSVGKDAFIGCTNLVYVDLVGAERIEDSAFEGCAKLGTAEFGKNLKYIGVSAFGETAITKLDLAALDLSAFSMGQGAFENCKSLLTVTLPNTLVEVPVEAFSNCTVLNSVTFGDARGSLSTIGRSAFEGCTKLVSLEFFNVKNYGSSAFAGCSGLKAITIVYEGNDLVISESAFPANPKNWKIEMTGKSPIVKDYAIRHEYTYHGVEYAVTIVYPTTSDKELVTVKRYVNNKEIKNAEKGDDVKITVAPKEGYSLKKITFATDSKGYYSIPDFSYLGDKDKVLSFELKDMPDKDVFVLVEMIANNKIKDWIGTPSMKFEHNNDYDFKSTGVSDRVIMSGSKADTGAWLWTFSSSAKDKIAITEDGVVTVIGKTVDDKGVTLKATLKADTSVVKSISGITVDDSKDIKSISFKNLEGSKPKNSRFYSADNTEYNKSGYDVIEIRNYFVSTSDLIFKVKIDAYTSKDAEQPYLVKSNWTSVDSKIASVGAASVYDNENRIVVKKGAIGETMITVSVAGKNDKGEDIELKKRFIVRVLDPTPRLSTPDITVNYASSLGTELGLVMVKGYPVDPNSLKLVDSKNKESGKLQINYKDGKFYISKHNNYVKFKGDEVFTGDTQLYVTGTFDGDSKEIEFPKIAITKITFTNKPLAPTLKTKNKINLFYKGASAGTVEVTQSIKDAAVIGYELYSVDKSGKKVEASSDKFKKNFDITYNPDNRTFTISRNDNEILKDDSKKAVVSGYFAISYAGYSNPVVKKFTVPNTVTKPAYALDVATTTKNMRGRDHVFDLKLVKKVSKTEVEVLDLDDCEVDLLYDYTTEYSLGVEDDTIHLRHNGYASNSKAQFRVRKPEWSDDLVYTFTLKATNALPANKLSVKSVTLNKNYPEETAQFELAALADGHYASLDVTPTGKNAADIASFELVGDRKVVVSLKEGAVTAGTYSFSVTPKVSFGGYDEPLKAATIKVVVTDKKPVVKLKSGTFTFNWNYPGRETISTTYSITNLPAGTEKTVDISDYTITPNGHNYKFEDLAEIKSFEGGNISIAIKDGYALIANKGKTLKFKVSGKVGANDMESFDLSIKLDSKAPSVSLKASGTINPIDRTSKVTYTATIKNLIIDDPQFKLVELDSKGVKLPDEQYHFELVQDEKNKKIVYVRVKDGKSVNSGVKYSLRISCTNVPMAKESKVTVTPKQALPKIKTDVTSKTIYSLQENRSFDVKVSHVVDKNTTVMKPAIHTIVWADGVSESIKDAFDYNYIYTSADRTSADLSVELVNPAAVVQNKTYTLKFAVKYDDQAENTAGNYVTVKVTVKK
ncbi:leucine-rich repeat domain-containing protein [Butyrivibrio sp. DSM 10294]|uniref:leucine-rich repeat domain-containing protein n=1 Tax=Butyrivibrio sp. DSM 10294 TaxID=2972457 RepID=UPI00234EE15C|nr:leucine-rich repeat domain-containing protein [Butyrivibrio sp. DSM 10294]MDC7294745.1 leucine-rich repeat domain-containing protein [Butyrivibrio sp. DSM 10294]